MVPDRTTSQLQLPLRIQPVFCVSLSFVHERRLLPSRLWSPMNLQTQCSLTAATNELAGCKVFQEVRPRLSYCSAYNRMTYGQLFRTFASCNVASSRASGPAYEISVSANRFLPEKRERERARAHQREREDSWRQSQNHYLRTCHLHPERATIHTKRMRVPEYIHHPSRTTHPR